MLIFLDQHIFHQESEGIRFLPGRASSAPESDFPAFFPFAQDSRYNMGLEKLKLKNITKKISFTNGQKGAEYIALLFPSGIGSANEVEIKRVIGNIERLQAFLD